MDKIEKAIKYATQAHLLQKRKHSGIPYIVHCIEVMKRVSDYGINDEVVLASAILHDVKEDCDIEYGEKILTEFGWTIHSIVNECTRSQGDAATKEEKYLFLKSFENKSIQSLIIKIADRYCNVRDYMRTPGKEKYASEYALQAYPLYQSFFKRHINVMDIIPRQACLKVLGDVIDLNIIINEEYKGFSCLIAGMDNYVRKMVIGDERNRQAGRN